MGNKYHFYDLINSADKEIMSRIEFIKLKIERARKKDTPFLYITIKKSKKRNSGKTIS